MKDNSKYFLGIFFVLISAVTFSAKAVFVKLAYLSPVDSITLLTLRMLFAFPFFASVVFYNRKKLSSLDLKKKDWFIIFLMGVAGYYLASLFDFIGLQYVTAGMERLILFVYPTLVVLLSRIFLKNKIGKNEFLSLVLTYSGILFVFYTADNKTNRDTLKGAAFIFACAFTYAVYFIGTEKLTPKLGSVLFASLALSISSIAVFIHFFIVKSTEDLNLPPRVYYLSIAMAIVSTVIPVFFAAEGIRLVGAGRAAIVGSIGPVSTIILGYFFLNEIISPSQGIGTLLVLAGVLIISVKKKTTWIFSLS